MYQIVVGLTIAAHLAFICYVVVGGFLALRWRRSFWLHMLTVTWGVLIVIGLLGCPLTWLKRWARAKAGIAPLSPEGLITHYITGVVYPADWAGAVELAVLAAVGLSWLLYLRKG